MDKSCKGYKHPFMGYIGKDIRHIMLKLVLVRRISKGPIYSYALMDNFNNTKISRLLNKKGIALKNDIYNTLASLERSGYIKSTSRMENGKKRNYYRLTIKGRQRLAESRMLFMKTMKELIKVMEE